MKAGGCLIVCLVLAAGIAAEWQTGHALASIAATASEEEVDRDSSGRHTLGPGIISPHGDLIFRATGTTSCRDCHRLDRDVRVVVLDTAPVRKLIDKGRGNHGPGRFADCFRCHAGGTKGIETK